MGLVKFVHKVFSNCE